MPIESYPKELINKYFHGSKNYLQNYLVYTATNTINKKNKKGLSSLTGSSITLTNNEIKYKIKVIKSLENKGVFLRGTSDKFLNQKGGLLNFLVH